MAYFADLTNYAYWPGEEHMLNVGWLSVKHPYRRGPVSLAFAHELERLAREPKHLTRVCHVCEFCSPPEDIIVEHPKYLEVWESLRCGNGEIHVNGPCGQVFCTPALILHYVAEHQYQPPDAFVEAVLHQRELRMEDMGLRGCEATGRPDGARP